MNRNSKTARPAFSFAATAAAALLTTGLTAGIMVPTAAHADITFGAACSAVSDTTGTSYDVKLCGVADVDQFRLNLAGNGNSHCGPGSLYNVLDWLETNKGLKSKIMDGGEPLTAYSPYDPEDQDEVTAWLGWLGWASGMPAAGGGTTSSGLREGFKKATSQAKSQGWHAETGGVSTDTTPEFGYEIAKRLRHAPVQIWYGRYTMNADKSLTRGGGHIVTVVSAKGDLGSGKVELTLADPGRAADHGVGDYLTTQSATRYETVTLYRMQINRKTEATDTTPASWKVHTYWRLLGPEYVADTFQFVEGLNWFEAAPPVG